MLIICLFPVLGAPVRQLLIRSFAFLILLIISLEVLFRVAIPACLTPVVTSEPEFHILHLDKTQSREGLFTDGRLAQHRANWHVNNYGWNSKIDYVSKGERNLPCIAVIGDSYVEGYHTPWEESLSASLADSFHNQYLVYPFGSSGATLLQYVKMARYADHHFSPDAFIFWVSAGKMVITIKNYDAMIGSSSSLNWRLNYEPNGKFSESRPYDYPTMSPARIFARQSAVIRYLCLNAKVNLAGGLVQTQAIPDEQYRSVYEQTSEKDMVYALAAKYIVERLQDYFPGRPIVFVVDANRNAIYESAVCPPPLIESTPIMSACKGPDCLFIDVTDVLYADFKKHGRKFNYEFDYHLNSYGNKVIADAVHKRLIDSGLLEQSQPHDTRLNLVVKE